MRLVAETIFTLGVNVNHVTGSLNVMDDNFRGARFDTGYV